MYLTQLRLAASHFMVPCESQKLLLPLLQACRTVAASTASRWSLSYFHSGGCSGSSNTGFVVPRSS